MKLLFLGHYKWVDNFIIYRIQYFKQIDKIFKFLINLHNLFRLLVLLLPCKGSDLSKKTLRLYRSRVSQIFLLAPSSTSTNLWAGLSCSSMSLDVVGISTGDKFSYLAKFCAAVTRWFLNRTNLLKSASPIVRFWISQNS